MATYTAWPVAADVTLLLTAANVTLRVTSASLTERQARVIADVTAEIARRTGRQFLADAQDTSRYFDGNGTSILEVDEMVSLTSAAVIDSDANEYDLSSVFLDAENGLPSTRLVAERGSMPGNELDSIFPAGRRNILVTGKFGFGSTVPADLWEAHAGECAHRLALEAGWRPTGRVAARKAGDVEVRYDLKGAEETGWHSRFEATVKRYTRPPGRRMRALRPRMI